VSLRRSTLFPLISLVILLAGEIVALMSHYDRRKKVLTFVSGILFVIAGECIVLTASRTWRVGASRLVRASRSRLISAAA
jgi:hypothetical protein